MPDLTRRVLTPELMDRDDVSVAALARSLAFLRQVNRYLGGRRAVLGHIRRWSRGWKPGQRITILDIATGSGDIPLAIACWAERAGFDVHITAVDRHPRTLALAAAHLKPFPQCRRIELVQADALNLPFSRAPEGRFDYCITSTFLHHLPDIEVLTVLRIMDALARRGIIWNDLRRDRRAYFWVRLLTRRADAMVQHDGPASVRAGFTRAEVLDFRRRLDLDYARYRHHFGHRFTLAGQK